MWAVWNRIAALIFAAALVVGARMQTRDLLEPWEDGHRGACAALFGLMAKNHLRYGLWVTGGVGIVNQERCSPEYFRYYTHHPQGCVLLATVGAVLGGTRSGLRLVFFPFAVGIVLLVHRIAKRWGTTARTAAGAFAATMPLGVYYGAFVNFEIPTIFLLLLTLHLYERYRRRGRRKDLYRAAAAQFGAVLMDWIALGLPLCLLVLEPMRKPSLRRRPARARFGTVALLLAAAGLSALATKIQVQIQLSRYGTPLDPSLRYLRDVTFLNPDFRWTRWAEAIRDHALTLVGTPALLLAAVGLLTLLPRIVRRRLDGADVPALCMLTIGAVNLTLLAQHAIGHDYYLLYLLPALACLAGRPFSLLERHVRVGWARPAALALVVLVAARQAAAAHDVVESRRSFGLTQLGEAIQAATKPGEVVFLAEEYFTVQVALASDRHVDFAPNPKRLELAKQRAVLFGLAGKPAVVVVPRAKLGRLDPEYSAWLREHPMRSDPNFYVFEIGPIG